MFADRVRLFCGTERKDLWKDVHGQMSCRSPPDSVPAFTAGSHRGAYSCYSHVVDFFYCIYRLVVDVNAMHEHLCLQLVNRAGVFLNEKHLYIYIYRFHYLIAFHGE